MFLKIKNHFNQKKLKDERYEFLFDEKIPNEMVVYDTETTGLNPKQDEILSIGAVKVEQNQIKTSQKFQRFIKPTNDINIESIKIHRIRNIDLQNAVSAEEAISDFLHFIGNCPLVGYYLEFDVAMINKYIKPWLGIKLPNRQVEVSGIYHDKKIKTIPDGIVDLRFDSIMKDLDLPIFGKHDAINDAIMTAMMYVKLQNIQRL